jgi:hypothetical protein
MWGNVGNVPREVFYLFLADTVAPIPGKGNEGNMGNVLGAYISFVSSHGLDRLVYAEGCNVTARHKNLDRLLVEICEGSGASMSHARSCCSDETSVDLYHRYVAAALVLVHACACLICPWNAHAVKTRASKEVWVNTIFVGECPHSQWCGARSLGAMGGALRSYPRIRIRFSSTIHRCRSVGS